MKVTKMHGRNPPKSATERNRRITLSWASMKVEQRISLTSIQRGNIGITEEKIICTLISAVLKQCKNITPNSHLSQEKGNNPILYDGTPDSVSGTQGKNKSTLKADVSNKSSGKQQYNPPSRFSTYCERNAPYADCTKQLVAYCP